MPTAGACGPNPEALAPCSVWPCPWRSRAMPNPEPLVYVVDDEASIRDSLAMLLRSVGLASRTFADARSFLAAYQPRPDACLVADVRMPGMSGIELQEALRTRGAELPIIIITGHGDIAMAVRAMKAGAAD